MPDEDQHEKGVLDRLVHAIERHKKRSWWILGAALVGLIITVSDVGGVASGIWSTLTNARSEREAPASLALGDAPESVKDRLGEPRQSLDLCSEIRCELQESHKPLLNVYRHDDYTVRAVFEGNKLEFYAVTRESENYRPHLKMPFDWGALGEFTYSAAITPDDVDAFHRRYPSYAEVKPMGPPGHDLGTVLGYTPDGYSDEQSLYLEGLSALDGTYSMAPKERVAAAEPFRAASKPNTQGIFQDGDYVGSLLHDAGNARYIISVGAER